jgi:dTDP-glucose 4,6-dehydratase
MSSLIGIGGSGFFGKSILDFYGRGGLEKWNVKHLILASRDPDILKIECPNLLKSNGVELLKLDITNCTQIPKAEFVIHAAASTDASNYVNFSEREKKNILIGTENFCNTAKKNLKDSKIIYISSGAVYGQQPENISHISEDEPFLPIESLPQNKRDYAAAKRDSELLIKKLKEYELSVSIARCFAFVGPWLPRNKHFAIGNFIESVKNKTPIIVNSNNLVLRSYMYADDLVEWLMEICLNSHIDCPIYNIGSEEEVSIQYIAKLLAEKYDLELKIPSISRENKIDRYIPSTRKVRRELNLVQKINLEEALLQTISEIKKDHFDLFSKKYK